MLCDRAQCRPQVWVHAGAGVSVGFIHPTLITSIVHADRFYPFVNKRDSKGFNNLPTAARAAARAELMSTESEGYAREGGY